MQSDLLPVNDERRGLTEAVVCRAVAESRTMRNDLAERDWYIAANLDPKLAIDLRNQIGGATAFPAIPDLWAPSPEIHWVGFADPSTVPPKIVSRTDFQYPIRARRLRLEADVVVESEIDMLGRVRKPRVLTKDLDPSLVFATLTALLSWSFEPARSADVPVAVVYNLTTKFKLETEK